MYKVFLNGELLYDGLCVSERSITIQSPTVTIDKEGGSFSFTVPKEHVLWPSFENETVLRRTSQIIIYEDDEWFWEGCIVDYGKDYFGNFKINCSGALQYLKNTTFPLENIVNITKNSTETNNAFFIRAFSKFVKEITTQHNNRINDLESVGYSGAEFSLRHQKIYFDSRTYDSIPAIEIDDGVVPPDHFSRVVNFETCYDALQKRIVDDFGGFFYLIKKHVTITSELVDQDSVWEEHTPPGGSTLLLLRYRMSPISKDNYVVYLGHNLLDYNISEDFDLATAAIPLGDTYDENHPGESRWWLKDERSAFHDITQRANYGWRERQLQTHPYYPTGGSRVFLPSSVQGASEIIAKYGMRDVIVEFDTIVAKHPQAPVWNPNGIYYIIGQYVRYRSPGSSTWEKYKVMTNVVSSPSEPPNTSSVYSLLSGGTVLDGWSYYMYIKGHSGEPIHWLSKDDYLGYNYINGGQLFEVYETPTGSSIAGGEGVYIEDYMLALRILAEDYLTNQQFNKLVLDISATKVSSTDGERFNALRSFGTKIPVSASLFGENLKPYEVTEVSIQLDDDGQSRLTLGGEDTKITKLINTK